MKIIPSKEEIKKYSESGKYDVFPLSAEILSDICTPIEAVRILKNVSIHTFMLESVTDSEKWGRYTFLGYNPKMEINVANGHIKAGDNPHCQCQSC